MFPDPSKADAQYLIFKEKQAQRLRERNQLDEQIRAEKEAAKARWDAVRLNEIHVAKKDYICECCGKTIPKGTEYRRQNIPVGFGWLEGTHFTQRKTHLVCCVEAKKQ